MRYALAASMMVLGLGACGGGGGGNAKAEFVKECVADSGESEETCKCLADATENTVGANNFSKLVNMAKSGDEDGAEKLMMELMGEDPAKAMAFATAMMSCSAG